MITGFLYSLAILMIIVSLVLSSNVKKTFKEWSQRPAMRGWTGADLARQILNYNGVYNVSVAPTQGNLSDNYNHKEHTVYLSNEVYYGNSIAALAVAAHECGHAVQYNEKYFPISFRTALFPVARLGSTAGFWIALIGILLSAIIPFSFIIVDIGILLFAFAVMFHVVTLPVEFNASKRAMQVLETNGVLTEQELPGAKKVLNAAAMTYVAAALSSVIQLFRFMNAR